MQRFTGKTTKQMKDAPLNSIYIWVHTDLYYPRALATYLNRTDLDIVPPHWLNDFKWEGKIFSGIIADHAVRFTCKQWDLLQEIKQQNSVAKGVHMPQKMKDPYIANIIQAAKELEEFLSTHTESFDSLRRIIRTCDEHIPACVESAGEELTIRTKLKEAIEDFEHTYILI